jgi:hypothetical protein
MVELHDNPMHVMAADKTSGVGHSPRPRRPTYAAPRKAKVALIGRRRPRRSEIPPASKAPMMPSKAIEKCNCSTPLMKFLDLFPVNT